jgi:hypothetical protein
LRKNWPITVNLLAVSGKDECHYRKSALLSEVKDITNGYATQAHIDKMLFAGFEIEAQPGTGKISVGLEDQRLPDQSPLLLRNRREVIVYQHDIASISRGKNTIFELTHVLETASCRAYPEELSGP